VSLFLLIVAAIVISSCSNTTAAIDDHLVFSIYHVPILPCHIMKFVSSCPVRDRT
jgi:hypothetical protein